MTYLHLHCTSTTITSCLYKALLHWDLDTMSRMHLPVSLDNNQAKHSARVLIDRAILVTRSLRIMYRYFIMPIAISLLLGSFCVLFVPVRTRVGSSWLPGGPCVFYLFSTRHVQVKYTDNICPTDTHCICYIYRRENRLASLEATLVLKLCPPMV